MVGLQVKISRHSTTVDFCVAPRLATKMFLGTASIDKEIWQVETNTQNVVPSGGRAVAIDESFEEEAAAKLLSGAKIREGETSETSPPMLGLAKKRQ